MGVVALGELIALGYQGFQTGWDIAAKLFGSSAPAPSLDALYALLSTHQFAIGALWQNFGDLRAAERYAVKLADDTGRAMVNTARHNATTWEIFIRDKYQPDIRLLRAEIRSKASRNVGGRIRNVERLAKSVAREEARTNVTVNRTLIPAAKSYRQFDYQWVHDYQPAVNTLRNWLKSPRTFSEWATAPVFVQAQTYLATKQAKPVLDTLLLLLANAMTDEPERILTAVENWLVTEY